MFQPGFRFAKPFGLRRPDQFRPPPPPELDSQRYAAAFNEVKDFGRVDSTVRTLDQTLYAVWWMEFTEGSVNRLARQLVTERDTNLWRAARMFALLNMSMFDGYVANLGFQVRVQPLASIHGYSGGGPRRQSGDNGGLELGAAPDYATTSGICVGPLYGVRLLIRGLQADVRRQCLVHYGDDDCSTRNADSFFRKLQCCRSGVRRLARAAWLPFPLRDEPRPGPRPCSWGMAGGEPSRVPWHISRARPMTALSVPGAPGSSLARGAAKPGASRWMTRQAETPALPGRHLSCYCASINYKHLTRYK